MLSVTNKWGDKPEIIREKLKSSPSVRTYQRFLAIALLFENETLQNVAKILGRDYSTITRWVNTYNQKGLTGLEFKPPEGQKPLLSDDQMKILKEAIRKAPSKSNLSGVTWTYKQLITFCEREFSVTMKERAAQKYFHRLGFVRKRPRQQYAKASEEKKKNL